VVVSVVEKEGDELIVSREGGRLDLPFLPPVVEQFDAVAACAPSRLGPGRDAEARPGGFDPRPS
jgi:hypothetical protein